MASKNQQRDLPGVAWTLVLAFGAVLGSWAAMSAMIAFMGLGQ